MQPPTKHALGRLRLSIAGSSPVADLLRRELAVDRPSAHEALELAFVDELPEPAGAVRHGPYRVTAGAVRFDGPRFGYVLEGGDAGIAVRVRPAPIGRRPRPDRRFRHWNYMSPAEDRAKQIVYDLIDFTSHLAQLPLGQSYVHASSACRDGEALVVLGWGGSGKSSSVLHLVLHRGWSFLSDDLAILDEDGTVWHHPKHMQLYAYNVEGDARLRRALFAGRGPVDRASWAYHEYRRGPKGVRRRVAPAALLGGERVAERARLRTAVLLLRGGAELRAAPIDAGALADAATATLHHELSPLDTVAAAVQAVPAATGRLELFGGWPGATRRTVAAALANATALHVLEVPESSTPAEVADALERLTG